MPSSRRSKASHDPGDDRGVHFVVRLVALLLLLAGLPLLIGGVMLIYYGGSWYYALAGAGIASAGLRLWRGRLSGVYLFLTVFLLTVLWSIYEVGFAFWPSVPRLVAPIFLGALVLLVAPLLRGRERPLQTGLFTYGGLAMIAAFAAFMAGTFWPHDIISTPFEPTPGKINAASLAAGNDWLAYGRTGHGTRYAPFDQITPENIDKLEVAWTAHTGFIADQLKNEQDQNVPLYVDGTLYQCGPVGQITALDGTTGEIKWQFDPKAKSDDWKRCRSVAYYDPGPGDSCGPRIVETTVDARLISVRASNGQPCETFGNGGTVNVWTGMGGTNPEYLTASSGPVVARDKIIFGGRVTDNVTLGEPSGVIRAFDAKTGAMAWVWDLGNPALSGIPTGNEEYTPGTPNAWTLLSFDADLGLVYIPLGGATPDIYGGDRRPFDDAYSGSVVALDIDTGKEVWKFQTTHHDLWDYDIPAQPVLADIPDGKGGTIPGLIQMTKRAQIFVLDRRTGEPIKAVEERPAPTGDGTSKGEYYAETQPYSPEMAAIGTKPLEGSMMWGATPIDQMMCRILLKKYRYDGEFTTQSTDWSIIFPGPLGGMNFGAAAVDEERNILVAAEMRMPLVQRLIPRADVTPDMKYTGESGPFAPMTGTPYAMERATFMSPLGIPCMQPPWGTVSAVDLASGKQIWQQPAGTAKDIAFGTFQPGLAFYVGLPPLGGPLVTKGGIAWYGGTQDYYLRAFDVVTGKLLWKGRLPVGSQATPISYVGKDGRQYVVINASGARYNMSKFDDAIVAFALPK